ncbi:MAG: cell division protein FtsI [Lachnospiraceae bacterium]|nr:cell division protein FtsI [Lachnospiraceae bacterium]
MRKKLIWVFVLAALAFVGLSIRLILINRDEGENYSRKVLSQQRYDSTTIPFRRGDIVDANGTVLAYSEKVYNIILDTTQLTDKEAYLEPTLNALQKEFGLDVTQIRSYVSTHPDSRYYILKKTMTFDEIAGFRALQDSASETYDENVKGIWFEENYIRKYPNGTLASDVIGFTTGDNEGTYGLEEYYDDVLNGNPGREFGYLDDDLNLERTTIPAEDGNTIVSTIDGNIQTIVTKYLREFNEEYKNNVRTANGAHNVGCIIMEVNTGNILAMAGAPFFDLNDTRNKDALIGQPMVDENGNRTGEYITEENVSTLEGDLLFQNYNALWKNFCITDTYEPGSVAKPFTIAGAIEDGSITGEEVYNCTGELEVGGWPIQCHGGFGHGNISVAGGIEQSCNVVMMKVSQAEGAAKFAAAQNRFGFGLRTGIDLAGEVRTVGLTYTASQLGPSELATNSFGQSFNVSMIEMISGYCSLINGGNYYEPHMVSKVLSSSGATIKNIEPRVLRQTVSPSTSEQILRDCNLVVSGENGTGKTARPAGYMIGGKTGTAETLPRGNREYVVSFMGHAPAVDPQIAIYVVVDRANAARQDDAKYATRIVRSILTETLPYLGIPMTETLTEEEAKELENLESAWIRTDEAQVEAEEEQQDTEPAVYEGTDVPDEEYTDLLEEESEAPFFESFEIDEETGYYVDPATGTMIDPETGEVFNAQSLPDGL